MKSPSELKMVLRRQWEAAAKRESRLLGGSDAWPVIVSIGRPKPKTIASDLDAVKRHVNDWRRVDIGEVVWESICYRATAGPVEMPPYWKIRQPSEWVAACADRPCARNLSRCRFSLSARKDAFIRYLFADVRSGAISLWTKLFRPLGSSWRWNRVVQAVGRSRTLSLEGIDTKFFERHATPYHGSVRCAF